MSTLISITSQQTLPNVLFAKEQKNINRYIFISTELMEGQHKTKHVLNSLSLSIPKENIVEVIEDSIDDIIKKLDKIEFLDSEEIIINLTGGTKIMAIAVYSFFARKSCKIFYIPFPKNEIVQIFPEIKQKVTALNYRVNLSEYFQSYDVQVETNSFLQKNQTLPVLLTNKLFEKNKNYLFRQNWYSLQNLGKELYNRPFINLQEERFSNVKKNLSAINYQTQTNGILSEKEIKYFIGGWWEEYLYHFIKTKLNLSDDQIGINIEINKDNSKRFSAGNEFDIIFIYENKFYVIECKTGIKDLAKTGIQVFNEYVYKLAALNKFFGLGAKLSLCILQSLPNDNEELRNFYQDRCEILNISLFSGTDFRNMNDFLNRLIK